MDCKEKKKKFRNYNPPSYQMKKWNPSSWFPEKCSCTNTHPILWHTLTMGPKSRTWGLKLKTSLELLSKSRLCYYKCSLAARPQGLRQLHWLPASSESFHVLWKSDLPSRWLGQQQSSFPGLLKNSQPAWGDRKPGLSTTPFSPPCALA